MACEAEILQTQCEEVLKEISKGIDVGIAMISKGDSFVKGDRNSYEMKIIFLNDVMQRWFPRAAINQEKCYIEYNKTVDEKPDQTEPCIWCPVIRAFENNRSETNITHSPDSEGKMVRHYSVTATPFEKFALEIVLDITHRVELEYLSHALTSVLSVEEALSCGIEVMGSIAQADCCFVAVLDRDKSHISRIEEYCLTPLSLKNFVCSRVDNILEQKKRFRPQYKRCESPQALNLIPISQTEIAKVTELNKPIIVESPSAEKLGKSLYDWAKANGIESILLLPVMVEKAVWSIVGLGVVEKEGKFDGNTIRRCFAAADRVGVAIELRYTQDELYLESRLSATGQALSGLSHNLANAISPIAGKVNLLRSSLKQDKDIASNKSEYLSKLKDIETGLESTLSLLKDVVTRVRSNQAGPTWVDVNELIGEAIELSRPFMQKSSQIRVTTRLAPDIPPIYANRIHIRQVFLDLIDNAVKAILKKKSDNGGEISISTTRYLENTTEVIRIQFRDDGCGIPQEIQPYLFDRFYRYGYKKSERSTGIGLWLAYRIIRHHGGKISVESSLGEGSTFTIQIPVTRKEDVIGPRNN